MTSTPRINLDKLVARIVLDVNLLHWFASHGGRRQSALASIALARQKNDLHERPILDFLQRVVADGL